MRTYCHVKCLKEVIVSFSDLFAFLVNNKFDPCVECDRVNAMLGEADEAKDEVNNNIGIVIGKIVSLNTNVKNVCFCPVMFCPPVNQNIFRAPVQAGEMSRRTKMRYFLSLHSIHSYLIYITY